MAEWPPPSVFIEFVSQVLAKGKSRVDVREFHLFLTRIDTIRPSALILRLGEPYLRLINNELLAPSTRRSTGVLPLDRIEDAYAWLLAGQPLGKSRVTA